MYDYCWPKMVLNKLDTSGTGPPLVERPATIHAIAQIPIIPAVTLNAVIAIFKISAEARPVQTNSRKTT